MVELHQFLCLHAPWPYSWSSSADLMYALVPGRGASFPLKRAASEGAITMNRVIDAPRCDAILDLNPTAIN